MKQRSASSQHYRASAQQFLGAASAWIVLLYALARNLPAMPLWSVALAILTLSLPIALSGIYASTVLRISGLKNVRASGWLHQFWPAGYFAYRYGCCGPLLRHSRH